MTGPLKDHLAQQITLEYQRKSAIESKSFSILTASLAFVTLYIALSNQVQLGANLKKSAPRDFLLLALISAVLAIALALWAARPVAYSNISTDDLNNTRERLRRTGTANVGTSGQHQIDTLEGIADELYEAQIRDLRDARIINTCRAKTVYLSLVFIGVEAASLIISLSIASSY